MIEELDQTIGFNATSDNGSSELGWDQLEPIPDAETRQSRVKIAPGRSSSGISTKFSESTRKLLRHRLIIAGSTLLGIMLLIKVVVIAVGKEPALEVAARSFSVTVLVGVLILLHRRSQMSLAALRWLEVVVIAIPIFEIVMIQYIESTHLLGTGQVAEVATLFATIGAVVSLFVAIYGMFIPSNWKRTAIIAGSAAMSPTLVGLWLLFWFPQLQAIDPLSWVSVVSMLAMAVVATMGAHVVREIRREVVSARQYGQYKLTEEIGRGGMGVVFKAQHKMLKRPAAIKLISTEASTSETAIASFEQEVQMSATLSHWNTVQIYDYGRTENDDFYYVMEYLEGESLRDRLRRRRGGKISVAETAAIVAQICDGLGEAHCRGMVHRDLKPANIYLAKIGGREDVVKILDFGLAICTASNSTPTNAAPTNSISGTPAYMSPEQAGAKPVDHRSDIYAVGCIMFECIVGKRMVSASSIGDALKQHLHQTPPLDQIPHSAGKLKEIIARCLSKDPAHRFEDICSLRRSITEL